MTTLLATGDLIIDEPDPDSYFEPARPGLRAADIVIGHVEVPFTLRRAGALIVPYEKQIARAAVDAGADVVISHHAHILRGIEMYKGKAIYHGLGTAAHQAIRLRTGP